jgi:hypothetical protein
MRNASIAIAVLCCLLASAGEKSFAAAEQADASSSRTRTLPAGTRVLAQLTSALHTVSAGEDAGVYLETIAPVIAESKVVIPARSQLQGTVKINRRPGRVKGRAELLLTVTTLILPNQRVLPISAALRSLPGNGKYEHDRAGMLQPVDQIDKDIPKIAAPALSGALLGALSRGSIGLGQVLISRGDDINLPQGTHIELVLNEPLTIATTEESGRRAPIATGAADAKSAATAPSGSTAPEPEEVW